MQSLMKEQHLRTDEHKARMMLLRAGIALFAERGYTGTSVREIVELAGVTKPVLYYYFKSKEGLFRAILDWAAEMQEGLLARALETPGMAMTRLIDLFQKIYEGISENRGLYRMIHNLFFGPSQGAPPYDIELFHRRMDNTIKTIFLKGLEQGELRQADADDVSILILSLTDFCFHLDYLHPESMNPGRLERLLRLAFQGLEKKDR
jgi:AcrR family transcriptional regulator